MPRTRTPPTKYPNVRRQVTRAFSFNKTPMKLIKRPVMSPQFGSTNSLTPASQLAKMKLASCTNINVNMADGCGGGGDGVGGHDIDTMSMMSMAVDDVNVDDAHA